MKILIFDGFLLSCLIISIKCNFYLPPSTNSMDFWQYVAPYFWNQRPINNPAQYQVPYFPFSPFYPFLLPPYLNPNSTNTSTPAPNNLTTTTQAPMTPMSSTSPPISSRLVLAPDAEIVSTPTNVYMVILRSKNNTATSANVENKIMDENIIPETIRGSYVYRGADGYIYTVIFMGNKNATLSTNVDDKPLDPVPPSIPEFLKTSLKFFQKNNSTRSNNMFVAERNVNTQLNFQET